MTESTKRRGRKAKVLGTDFFLSVIEAVNAGSETSKDLGISGYYLKSAMDRGFIERVEKEKEEKRRGRKSKVYVVTDKGHTYVKQVETLRANAAASHAASVAENEEAPVEEVTETTEEVSETIDA